MNRELLEKLLMDQALNELSAESTALLDAYLADHPELQSLADSIQETVAIGQKAVRTELPTLPAFPKERLLSPSRPAAPKMVGRWMSIAASLLIGIGIGTSSLLWQPKLSQEHTGGGLVVQAQPASDGYETARAFWSPKTYLQRYQESRKERSLRNENTELKNQVQKFKKRGLL